MSAKKLLFLLRKPPYEGALAYESLEAVLVAGVFEQSVSVLFTDDGVYQILDGQDATELGTRNVADGYGALPTYEIDQVFVDAASLAERNLAASDLAIPAVVLDREAIRALIRDQDVVLPG